MIIRGAVHIRVSSIGSITFGVGMCRHTGQLTFKYSSIAHAISRTRTVLMAARCQRGLTVDPIIALGRPHPAEAAEQSVQLPHRDRVDDRRARRLESGAGQPQTTVKGNRYVLPTAPAQQIRPELLGPVTDRAEQRQQLDHEAGATGVRAGDPRAQRPPVHPGDREEPRPQ